MTLRERAEEVISEIDAGLYYTSDEEKERVLNHIEQVMKNAIEEDRKSRECCKAERESCAEKVDDLRRRGIVDGLGDAIRARSDS